MSLPELTTPIRIYWDLTPLPAEPPDHEKIVADILELKILNLDITATGSTIPSPCFFVLEKCARARIAVTLTITPSALSESAAVCLATAPAKELLFEISSIKELHSLTPLPSGVTGISFPPGEQNWPQIPEVIRFCSEKSIKRLVFPMQRLYNFEAPYHIPADGLAAISDSLKSFVPDSGLRITVHDPFVWRAIFPYIPFPEGSCQAANTMLSIDQNGIVYPCPVMPVPLGILNELTLKEIAKGELKKAVRSRLLALPAECTKCTDAVSCKGGCRGRGERVFGSWEALDPGCR